MKKKIFSLILIIGIIFSLAATPVEASTTAKYATKTISLKTSVKGKVIYKIKRNTKVKIIREGKKWASVRYKNKKLYTRKAFLCSEKSPKLYTAAEFKQAGVIWWKGRKFTYYSQRILPGYGLWIPGRHLDKDGYVCDKNGYIALGSNTANRYKFIATPFGRYAKVYDAGYVGTYWFDVYTNW